MNVKNVPFDTIGEENDVFFNLTHDILCVGNRDGFFKKINPAFVKTIGFSEHEILAQSMSFFLHPDDLEKTEHVLQTIKNETTSQPFENRYR